MFKSARAQRFHYFVKHQRIFLPASPKIMAVPDFTKTRVVPYNVPLMGAIRDVRASKGPARVSEGSWRRARADVARYRRSVSLCTTCPTARTLPLESAQAWPAARVATLRAEILVLIQDTVVRLAGFDEFVPEANPSSISASASANEKTKRLPRHPATASSHSGWFFNSRMHS